MKYIDEFRDREKAAVLVKEIETLVATIPLAKERPLHIMEVCGGHTHSIFRYGVEGIVVSKPMPKNTTSRSGFLRASSSASMGE